MKITDIEATTGIAVKRDATDEEMAELIAIADLEAKRIQDATAKAAEKAALLERLGITAEEATLLLS